MSRSVGQRRVLCTVLVAMVIGGSLTGCGIGPAFRDAVERAMTDVDELEDESVRDEGNTRFEDLRIGDCLNDADVAEDAAVASIDVVDCTEPHDSELYGTATLDPGPYPSDDELYELADEGCFAPFEDYVGRDYESSTLDFSYYTPTRLGWKYGDREVTCVLFDVEEQRLTGSAKDSGL